MLATANVYLQALASQARAEAVKAQLASAQALHQQAIDLKQNGLVAGLDVVRAEVQVSILRQRATAAPMMPKRPSCRSRASSGCRSASRSR